MIRKKVANTLLFIQCIFYILFERLHEKYCIVTSIYIVKKL